MINHRSAAPAPRVDHAEIAAASIDTGHRRRDRDLRSQRSPDAAGAPVIAFGSLGRETPAGSSPPLPVELTSRDRRMPRAPAVERAERADGDPQFAAQGEIDRRALGGGTRGPELIMDRRIEIAVERVARAAG